MKQIFILCLLVPFVVGTSNYCNDYNEFRYNLIRAVNTNLKEITHSYDVNNDHYIDMVINSYIFYTNPMYVKIIY